MIEKWLFFIHSSENKQVYNRQLCYAELRLSYTGGTGN